jgi:OmpA-OmpF porin, OOP family
MSCRSAARLLVALSAALWMTAGVVAPAASQEAPTTEAMISALSGLEAPSDLDVSALRQQAAERIKARADLNPIKRPPLSRELNKLPHVDLDIQFNPDAPVIRPESYRTIARIADALTDPALMSFTFLIVGHIDATGRRDNNLALSQRRAEAIRDALVTTFKVSSKRVLAVGLGEEQLLDANNPKAAVNQQAQILTLREVAQVAGGGSVKPVEAGRPAKSATSRKGGR